MGDNDMPDIFSNSGGEPDIYSNSGDKRDPYAEVLENLRKPIDVDPEVASILGAGANLSPDIKAILDGAAKSLEEQRSYFAPPGHDNWLTRSARALARQYRQYRIFDKRSASPQAQRDPLSSVDLSAEANLYDNRTPAPQSEIAPVRRGAYGRAIGDLPPPSEPPENAGLFTRAIWPRLSEAQRRLRTELSKRPKIAPLPIPSEKPTFTKAQELLFAFVLMALGEVPFPTYAKIALWCAGWLVLVHLSYAWARSWRSVFKGRRRLPHFWLWWPGPTCCPDQ